MAKRINVLFLPPKDMEVWSPWGDDVVAEVGSRHNLTQLDYTKPLAPQFKGIDMVVDYGGSMGTREMVDVAHDTRLWQVLGTGLDHFDLDYWRSKKMPVANCPGPFSSVALAECAMMFILMLTRHYNRTQDMLKAHKFNRPAGIELIGKKLGLVGFGASAMELAQRAKPFGIEMSAIDIREVSDAEREQYGVEWVGKPDDLDAMLADADFVSLHLHLNKETRHTIDARRLALMKPSAYLINVARGALVDEAALEAALVQGKLAGAGLDVFGREPPDLNAPLFHLPNVITTPHIAGVTDGTSRKRAGVAATNADRLAAGLEPLYRVD
jgi:D-3-phosphoglycerate dehydrogenase